VQKQAGDFTGNLFKPMWRRNKVIVTFARTD
jgi:hypothetical protein